MDEGTGGAEVAVVPYLDAVAQRHFGVVCQEDRASCDLTVRAEPDLAPRALGVDHIPRNAKPSPTKARYLREFLKASSHRWHPREGRCRPRLDRLRSLRGGGERQSVSSDDVHQRV